MALALKLKSLGHETIFCSSKNFEKWVTSVNLTYKEFGSDIQKVAQDNAELVGGKPIKLFKFILTILEQELKLQFEQLITLLDGVDIVVGASIQLVAEFVTKAFNIPYFFIAYAPTLIPSSYHPPITIPFDISNNLVNNSLWWINDKLWNIAIKKQANFYRKKLKLKPIENFLDPLRELKNNLILSSYPELAPLPPDLSGKISQTGTLFYFTDEKMPQQLEKFLDDDKPIIYVGFGSMTDHEPDKTTDLIVNITKKSDVKIVLSKGWANLGNGFTNNENIMVINDISHHILFPKLSAIIHHGGAGTTSVGALAGTPQIIIPHLMDQYYWGKRINTLGLGPKSISKNKLNSDNLSKSINETIKNKDFKNNAIRLKNQLLLRDGLTEASNIIVQNF